MLRGSAELLFGVHPLIKTSVTLQNCVGVAALHVGEQGTMDNKSREDLLEEILKVCVH